MPEVDPQWVQSHGCQVRLVDVRELPELGGPLGHIEDIEHVPLRELDHHAADWDPTTPVVLVCRSGRRSARGAAMLEAQGFEHVASMTGGMQRWTHDGLPIRQDVAAHAARAPAPAPVHGRPLTAKDIERHLGSPEKVRWVKTAALLLQGVESCVDGRDDHPVIGTPGGDAGEMLLGLATLEQLSGRPLTAAEVDDLLGAHLDAFGRFYLHSDDHALLALGKALQASGKWDDHFDDLHDVHGLTEIVRRPPRDREEHLLAALVDADHVGCGHLRLTLEHPEEYGVRRELVQALLRAFFRRHWAGDPRLTFVVLEGEHGEGAVVRVVLPHDVQPYTQVPAIAPLHRATGTTLFVAHPQLTAYLRQQNAHWLVEQLGSTLPVPGGLETETLLTHQQALADQQLTATLRYLAAGLPVYEATLRDDGWSVEFEGPVPADGG